MCISFIGGRLSRTGGLTRVNNRQVNAKLTPLIYVRTIGSDVTAVHLDELFH
jgi:hypothetical protein